MIELKDKYGPWALVTGASSGIGREFALLLATLGFDVVLTGRNRAALDEVAEQIKVRGTKSRVIVADLSRDGGTELLAQCHDLEIGLLVANAGFGTSGAFGETDLSSELEMLKVNCEAPMTLIHGLLPKLRHRKRGGIILLSSIVAWQGVANQAHYSATKAYVQNFAEGLREELRGTGIDVLASAPGPVDTGFAKRAELSLAKSDDAREVAHQTLQRLGKGTTAIPGKLSKILTFALATAPRALRIKIMSGVAKGMIQKNDHPKRPTS